MDAMKLFGFGQPLYSSLRIPGALPDEGGRAPSLVIESASVSRGGENGWRHDGDAVVYEYEGLARFRCGAERITVDIDPAANSDLVAEALVANALPATLWQQDSFMLHAAGVVLPGCNSAIAISGRSGIGKSGLARALVESMAALVGDDSLSLRVEGGKVGVSGLPGGTFDPIAANMTRHFQETPAGRTVACAPLGAIVFLCGSASTGAPARVVGADAIELLLAHRHRSEIPALLGRRAQVFKQAAVLARRVPIFVWTRGLSILGVTAEEIAMLRSLSPPQDCANDSASRGF